MRPWSLNRYGIVTPSSGRTPCAPTGDIAGSIRRPLTASSSPIYAVASACWRRNPAAFITAAPAIEIESSRSAGPTEAPAA